MTLKVLEGNCARHYTTGSHNIGTIKHLFIYMQKNEAPPKPHFLYKNLFKVNYRFQCKTMKILKKQEKIFIPKSQTRSF